jgi:hypothetical protein
MWSCSSGSPWNGVGRFRRPCLKYLFGRGKRGRLRLPFGFVGRKGFIVQSAKDGIRQTWDGEATDPGPISFLFWLQEDLPAFRIAGFRHGFLRLLISPWLGRFHESIRGEPAAKLFRDITAIGLFLSHHDDEIVTAEQDTQIIFCYQLPGGSSDIHSVLCLAVGVTIRSAHELSQAVDNALVAFVAVLDSGAVGNAYPRTRVF